mmetsp:Transcript_75966/g.162987  ORF Transcript_75966/g.162987 Transcript_75966/m.162987 type:complete len:240 (-) Transcript_75966:690-1409(-)
MGEELSLDQRRGREKEQRNVTEGRDGERQGHYLADSSAFRQVQRNNRLGQRAVAEIVHSSEEYEEPDNAPEGCRQDGHKGLLLLMGLVHGNDEVDALEGEHCGACEERPSGAEGLHLGPRSIVDEPVNGITEDDDQGRQHCRIGHEVRELEILESADQCHGASKDQLREQDGLHREPIRPALSFQDAMDIPGNVDHLRAHKTYLREDQGNIHGQPPHRAHRRPCDGPVGRAAELPAAAH